MPRIHRCRGFSYRRETNFDFIERKNRSNVKLFSVKYLNFKITSNKEESTTEYHTHVSGVLFSFLPFCHCQIVIISNIMGPGTQVRNKKQKEKEIHRTDQL